MILQSQLVIVKFKVNYLIGLYMKELNTKQMMDVNGGNPLVVLAAIIILDNIAEGWNEAHESCGC